MLGVTIDTNCINARQRDGVLNELEERARTGQLKLTATAVMLEELDRDFTTLGQARREKAARMPIARSGFMVGHSAVGGHDVIGGPDAYGHVDALAAIVFPGTGWEDLDPRTQRDIMHLSAHLTYGWDIFVSRDRAVLAAAETLQRELGLRVMCPEDALAMVRRDGTPA
jgi:hypothetical protein